MGRLADILTDHLFPRLPYRKTIDAAWIAHGRFDEPERFIYIEDTESAAPTLKMLLKEKIKLGFFGHTHVPEILGESPAAFEWLGGSRFRISSDHACVITVGAVVQPRHATDRRAAWGIWDSETRVAEFRKTDGASTPAKLQNRNESWI